MKEINFLDELAADLTALFSNAIESLFGPGVRDPFGSVTWSDLGATACFILLIVLLHGLLAALLHQKTKQAKADAKELNHHFFGALGKPLYLLIWIYGVYLAATPLLLKLPAAEQADLRGFFGRLFDLGVFAVLFWLFFRFTYVLESHLAAWAAKTESKLDDLFVPLIGKSLRVIVPVVGIIFALPVLTCRPNTPGCWPRAQHSPDCGGGVDFIPGGQSGRKSCPDRIRHQRRGQSSGAESLYANPCFQQNALRHHRPVHHRVGPDVVRGKCANWARASWRRRAWSGVILGFAAQKTIANLFAGFQIAMTQPIRLDDVVIVEGEWGRVEEITLTYVIIHIWDDRRLVVPLVTSSNSRFRTGRARPPNCSARLFCGWIIRSRWRRRARR